jgi:hypothetical protein
MAFYPKDQDSFSVVSSKRSINTLLTSLADLQKAELTDIKWNTQLSKNLLRRMISPSDQEYTFEGDLASTMFALAVGSANAMSMLEEVRFRNVKDHNLPHSNLVSRDTQQNSAKDFLVALSNLKFLHSSK